MSNMAVQLMQTFEMDAKNTERPVVLVIDDQPCILDMLFWMLYLQGYQPVCATNGQDALEWLKRASRTEQYPVAILLDLFMPVMDGRSFLTHLHSDWRASAHVPPTILLTVDKNNYDHLACDGVLLKPFHITDLSERLGQVIRKEPVSR